MPDMLITLKNMSSKIFLTYFLKIYLGLNPASSKQVYAYAYAMPVWSPREVNGTLHRASCVTETLGLMTETLSLMKSDKIDVLPASAKST